VAFGPSQTLRGRMTATRLPTLLGRSASASPALTRERRCRSRRAGNRKRDSGKHDDVCRQQSPTRRAAHERKPTASGTSRKHRGDTVSPSPAEIGEYRFRETRRRRDSC
jgi:hypothetical protein